MESLSHSLFIRLIAVRERELKIELSDSEGDSKSYVLSARLIAVGAFKGWWAIRGEIDDLARELYRTR